MARKKKTRKYRKVKAVRRPKANTALIASLGVLREDFLKRTEEVLAKRWNPFFYAGSEQRHTKNLGNYESFSYGFSIVVPVQADALDDIETDATKEKLRKKYEAMASFLVGMIQEAEGNPSEKKHIDVDVVTSEPEHA